MFARCLCTLLGALCLSLAPRTAAARQNRENDDGSTWHRSALLVAQDMSMIDMDPANFHPRVVGTRARVALKLGPTIRALRNLSTIGTHARELLSNIFPARQTTDDESAEVRPDLLVPLYIGMAALQALDLHSTLMRTQSGAAREVNPILAPAAQSLLAMAAIKTAATVAIVAANERLWKEHRLAAIVLMAAANSGYAVVAAHNYRVAARR